jgi:hypothetical protein
MPPDREERRPSAGGGARDAANVLAILWGGDLLDLSDERDRELRWRLQAWRDGWRSGHADGYEAGRLDAVKDMKRIQHDLAGVADDLGRSIQIEELRWWLRGQARTRQTFADPHPGDYPGRGAA